MNPQAMNKVFKTLGLSFQLPIPLHRNTEPWHKLPLAGRKLYSEKPGIVSKLGGEEVSEGGLDGVLAFPKTVNDLYQTFQTRVTQLRNCSHSVILSPMTGLPGVEGFTRSLAKEIGKNGSTLQLLRCENFDNLDGLLSFFLSDRSSFISGQVLKVAAIPAEPDSLRGKRILLTGAARGIGAAMAKVLDREGAEVLGVDHPSQGDFPHRALSLDLGEAEAIPKMIDLVRNNPLDGIINNAGITRDRFLKNLSLKDWESVIQINATVPIQLVDRLVELSLLKDSARVLYLSSIVGIAGNFGQTNYSTSKAALIEAVEEQSKRFASRSIAVNAVAPGYIKTQMTAKMPAMSRFMVERMTSLKQGGEPEDVAEAAAFLVSPLSRGITGNVLRICGQSVLGA